MNKDIRSGWYGSGIFDARVVYYDFDNKVVYGFNSIGEWIKIDSIENIWTDSKFYFKSNTLKDNFLNHIEKLGFKDGCYVKETFGGHKNHQIIGFYIDISPDFSFITLGNTVIYREGIWLEVVKEEFAVIPTETYYYYKNNFYKVDETIKAKSGDKWEDYVIYIQTGSGLRFARPAEIFYKKFKKVEV